MDKFKPLFLILNGDGVNCERETARAIESVGGRSEIIHASEFVDPAKAKKHLGRSQALVLPGGFSFGDHLGAGRILAFKLRESLGDQLKNFAEGHRLVLGICNGFQVLSQFGMYDELGVNGKKINRCRLAQNSSGRFMNKWVQVECTANDQHPWLRNLSTGVLPVRHGEGRLVLEKESETKGLNFQLKYSEDINGSFSQAAGLSSFGGKVMGLMPHPEAALFGYQRKDVAGIEELDKDNWAKTFWKNSVNFFD